MVRDCKFHHYSPTYIVNQRLPQDKGQSLVLASCGLSNDGFHVYSPSAPHRAKKAHSVVICTYGRPESLNETLKSLNKQTFKDFEVILITEKGDLSALRQKGLELAVGNSVSFIDDDVYCPPIWAWCIYQTFKTNPGIVGVTGPTTVKSEYRNNRDIFRHKFLREIHDKLFLGNLRFQPARLSKVGCPSMASNDEDLEVFTKRECDYLEACNMSIRRKEALDAGGFDNVYVGTSEWCELDLALKIRHKGTFLFLPEAGLFHRPSIQGVYGARLRTAHRWRNFKSFQKRWVRPSGLRLLYWAWVWVYLKMKEMQMI